MNYCGVMLTVLLLVILMFVMLIIHPFTLSMQHVIYNKDSYWDYEPLEIAYDPVSIPVPNRRVFDPDLCLTLLDLQYRSSGRHARTSPSNLEFVDAFYKDDMIRLMVWKSRVTPTYFVVFSGVAEGSGDTKRCFDYRQQEFSSHEGVLVHTGFHLLFLKDYGKCLLRALEQYPEIKQPGNTIYCSGQSLGTSQALYSSLYLSAFCSDVRLYLFGSSRVGNRAFGDLVESRVSEYFNFLNTDDIFCHLPFATQFVFSHSEKKRLFSHSGKEVWRSCNEGAWHSNHMAKTYIKIVRKIKEDEEMS